MFKKCMFFLGAIIMGIFNISAHSSETVSDFSFESLIGQEGINLGDYHGKVIVVVNTASKCGLTPQYKGLEALYQKYQEDGLVLIGVPSNNFGGQEPGTNEEISNFCEVNFGVTFPMSMRYDVIGKNAHPFYVYAREKLGGIGAPKWNFHKYLINRKGELVQYFFSMTKPESSRFTSAIEAELGKNF